MRVSVIADLGYPRKGLVRSPVLRDGNDHETRIKAGGQTNIKTHIVKIGWRYRDRRCAHAGSHRRRVGKLRGQSPQIGDIESPIKVCIGCRDCAGNGYIVGARRSKFRPYLPRESAL